MSRRLVDGKKPVVPKDANKGGREPDLTDELETRILNSLRMGLTVNSAGAFQGIGYATLRSWVLKGKADPSSRYGAFIMKCEKAIAEFEHRDVSVLDAHAHGRPAQYEMEVVRDADGSIVFEVDSKTGERKPLKQIARDGDGRPIIRASEIRSDWRVAMQRLARRLPRYWGTDERELDKILLLDAPKVGDEPSKETISLDERIERAVREIEDDV